MKYAKQLGLSGKIATAVSMFLLANNAMAIVTVEPGASVPEPATLGLLAIGAVAGGAAYLRNKRKK